MNTFVLFSVLLGLLAVVYAGEYDLKPDKRLQIDFLSLEKKLGKAKDKLQIDFKKNKLAGAKDKLQIDFRKNKLAEPKDKLQIDFRKNKLADAKDKLQIDFRSVQSPLSKVITAIKNKITGGKDRLQID